ncbi:agamous-like MADS-box protein AGL80 [Oryza glaberrima]|uniref:MADS-box domain-containing protein n=2 Tax=Oryza TaxID=4527 RepID=A0A0D3FKS4_9ORYZ|nr:agamous-like MADS-box protein AGL80 [Oryza glaberrima]
MARNKVKLQRIINDAKRRATFKKRLKGLMKKASELATLCSVDTCLMVYGEGEAQATVVWPSESEVMRVLERFKALPQLDKYKKMTDLEGFIQERIDKLQEQLDKVRRDADESETKLLLIEALEGRRPGLEEITIEQLTSLGWLVDARLNIVNDQLQKLHEQGLLPASVSLPTMGVLPYTTAGYTVAQEAPIQRGGWLVGVVRGIGSLGYSLFRGSGRSNTAGSSGDMVQPFNIGAGSSLANQGISFPPK